MSSLGGEFFVRHRSNRSMVLLPKDFPPVDRLVLGSFALRFTCGILAVCGTPSPTPGSGASRLLSSLASSGRRSASQKQSLGGCLGFAGRRSINGNRASRPIGPPGLIA